MSRNGIRGIAIFAAAAMLLAAGPLFVEVSADEAQPGAEQAIETMIKAIKEKLLPLPDDFAFICGHGPASNIGNERANNPFLV